VTVGHQGHACRAAGCGPRYALRMLLRNKEDISVPHNYLCAEIAVMPSVDVLKLVFRQRRKILSSPNLKLCQFSLQPSKFQKAGGYFTEVTAHEFATIPAAGAMVNICQCVLNDLFAGN